MNKREEKRNERSQARWGRVGVKKKKETLEPWQKDRTRVDETQGGPYRVTKCGPMVHGIQFYTSCARAHGLKDKRD